MFGTKGKAENIYVVPDRTADEQALLDRVIAWTDDGTLTWTDSEYPIGELNASPSTPTPRIRTTFRLSMCDLYVETDSAKVMIQRVCPELTDAVDRARDKRRAELIQRLVAL